MGHTALTSFSDRFPSLVNDLQQRISEAKKGGEQSASDYQLEKWAELATALEHPKP